MHGEKQRIYCLSLHLHRRTDYDMEIDVCCVEASQMCVHTNIYRRYNSLFIYTPSLSGKLKLKRYKCREICSERIFLSLFIFFNFGRPLLRIICIARPRPLNEIKRCELGRWPSDIMNRLYESSPKMMHANLAFRIDK